MTQKVCNVTIPHSVSAQPQLNHFKVILGHYSILTWAFQSQGSRRIWRNNTDQRASKNKENLSIPFRIAENKRFLSYCKKKKKGEKKTLVAFPQEPSHTVKTTRPQCWKMARSRWPVWSWAMTTLQLWLRPLPAETNGLPHSLEPSAPYSITPTHPASWLKRDLSARSAGW